MTFGEILFWLLVIILLIILYKLSPTVFWVILIIAILIFVFRLARGPVVLETHTQFDDSNQLSFAANGNLVPYASSPIYTGGGGGLSPYASSPIYTTGGGLIPDRSTNQAVLNSLC